MLSHEKLWVERVWPRSETGDRYYLLLLGEVDHDRCHTGDIDEVALQDTQRDPGGTTGIDRVAAALQDVKPGGCSEVMARRDRVLCHGDGRPMRK